MGKLTEAQRVSMLTDYQRGVPGTAIARGLGVDTANVYRYIRRHGGVVRDSRTAHRRLPVNESAFDVVTEESAYWLGFLMADGNVVRGAVRLGLNPVDADHVTAFRDFLGSGHAITYRRQFPPAVTVSVTSRSLVESLARYGVVPRKSATAQAAGGLEHDRHFWRGVVDGDGHLALHSRGGDRSAEVRAVFSIAGSEALMCQLQAFLRESIQESVSILRPWPSHWIRKIAVTGRKAIAVCRLLYDGCSVALARKQAAATAILAARPPRGYRFHAK